MIRRKSGGVHHDKIQDDAGRTRNKFANMSGASENETISKRVQSGMARDSAEILKDIQNKQADSSYGQAGCSYNFATPLNHSPSTPKSHFSHPSGDFSPLPSNSFMLSFSFTYYFSSSITTFFIIYYRGGVL